MRQITIDGPGLNALGSELMASLIAQIEGAGGEPLLLTGAGRAFSAGLNLKEVVEQDEAGLARFLGLLSQLCTALYHYPGPTVAWVNGHAIAGGCLLMLFCDQRFMVSDPRARVGLNEVALGVTFPPNILSMIMSRIPRHHLDEVLLGGALHGPEDARRLGLVDAVVEDTGERARATLTALSQHPADGYARMKAAIRSSAPVEDPDDRLVRELASAWASPDVRQRLAAALKR